MSDPKEIVNTQVNTEWETRQSTCCGAENNNTDNDICPDCKEHAGFEYLNAAGETLFED